MRALLIEVWRSTEFFWWSFSRLWSPWRHFGHNKDTTLHKQLTNLTRIPTQNHSRNSPNTKLSLMPITDTRHQTHTWLPKGADGPGHRGAMGRSWRGGEGWVGSRAVGLLVGSAGMGPGAGMMGEEPCRLPLVSTITTTRTLERCHKSFRHVTILPRFYKYLLVDRTVLSLRQQQSRWRAFLIKQSPSSTSCYVHSWGIFRHPLDTSSMKFFTSLVTRGSSLVNASS